MKLDLLFKKILRILTYNGDGDGDGDNFCGDGVGMGTMSRGWGGDGVVSSSTCQSLPWTCVLNCLTEDVQHPVFAVL